MYMKLLDQLFSKRQLNASYLRTIKQNNLVIYAKFIKMNIWIKLKAFVKSLIPPLIFNKLGLQPVYLNTDRVNFGDLNRTEPLSAEFGYDRGGPVDRYYIENFLEKNKASVKGTVLEIGDNEYTLRFGEDRLEKSETLHVNDSNPQATYIGDLTYAPMIPDDHLDCIILTQTLHLIYDHQKALETCYRILKKGGVLLMTSPGISQIDRDEWRDIWLWSFTQKSVVRMLSEFFEPKDIHTETYGNVMVATAFLYGLGLPEIEKAKMDVMDPHYQVIISAIATKR
jgi:SAM-dependent methyltransferase